MKALVTGATGMVGRHLSKRLAAEGWDVLATGRNVAIGQTLVNQGVRFVPVDLVENENLEELTRGRNIVFHCAALSSAWGKKETFFAINAKATKNLLKSALANKVQRFIHLSSSSVYFDFSDRNNIHEDDPLPVKPVNDYAWSKRESEEVVREITVQGLDAVILRPRGIIGPYDTALTPRLVKASKFGFLPLPRGGRAFVDYTCVENLIDAILLTADLNKNISGRTYNISNGSPISVRELLGQALKALNLNTKFIPVPFGLARKVAGFAERRARNNPTGLEPRITEYALGLLAFNQTLDITAAKRELGYRPRVSLEEGLSVVSEWWKQAHVT